MSVNCFMLKYFYLFIFSLKRAIHLFGYSGVKQIATEAAYRCFFTAHPRPRVLLLYLYSINSGICCPSDHTVDRPRADIRTDDKQVHLPIYHHTSLKGQCPRSQQLGWHCVCVLNDYAAIVVPIFDIHFWYPFLPTVPILSKFLSIGCRSWDCRVRRKFCSAEFRPIMFVLWIIKFRVNKIMVIIKGTVCSDFFLPDNRILIIFKGRICRDFFLPAQYNPCLH